MAVNLTNTNSAPMGLDALVIQSPMLPKSILAPSEPVQPTNDHIGNTSPTPVVGILEPKQVIGLVPVFKCCDPVDATAWLNIIQRTAWVGNAIYTADIDGTNIGNWTITNTSTANSVETDIDTLLLADGRGITCDVTTVVGATGMTKYSIIFYAPANSGSTYNGHSFAPSKISSVGCAGCSNISSYGGFDSGTNHGDGCDPSCDCRQGAYTADSIADDQQFPLVVFGLTDCDDGYKGDYNSFLFNFPTEFDPFVAGIFKLEKQDGNGDWNVAATLTDDTYGEAFYNDFFVGGTSDVCQNVNYQGYRIDWNLVFELLGIGNYRLKLSGKFSDKDPYEFCFATPPFCLKEWDCIEANGTVKFESIYNGGKFGSVTKQGESYTLCCSSTLTTTKKTTVPISWRDSIRFYGFFGYETAELQRDQIKYATGEIKKVRDEAVKSFTVKTDKLPMWLHQRFMAYGLMADKLLVSDYNLNNANYNYKQFWVVADSSYAPKYTTNSRYMKILDLKFKEGVQYVFRDRCC